MKHAPASPVPPQSQLFDPTDAPPVAPRAAAVAMAACDGPAEPLGPEQQRFHRLQAQVEKLSQRLQALRALGDAHRPVHVGAIAPLQQRRRALLRQMVELLDRRLDAPGLSRNHRAIALDILCALALDLARHGDADMQAVHDRRSQRSVDDMEQQAAVAMRGIFEQVLGADLDLPDDPDNLEDVLNAAMEHIRQQQDQAQARRDARRKSRAQTARQQQQAQQQQDAQGALRTIFRQLASALHPDREADPAQRARKTDLMGQANAAYGRRDLMALLKLQMQVEPVASAGTARLVREQAQTLSLLLKQQVDALQAEVVAAQQQLYDEFGLEPMPNQLTAAGLRRALSRHKQALEGVIALMQDDLRRLTTDAELKRWLKAQAALEEADPLF